MAARRCSELGGEAPSPAAEARIAGAGPLTSLLLGGIYLFRARHQSFPVTGNGGRTVTGLVTLDCIRHVPADQRDRTRLADIACPLTGVAKAWPNDSVADILPRLTECADRRALVFNNGHLAGIITPSDITRMIDRLSPRQSPNRVKCYVIPERNSRGGPKTLVEVNMPMMRFWRWLLAVAPRPVIRYDQHCNRLSML